ncbi:MAG: response regulator [Gemmatimonadales bacterium]
MQLLLVEDDRDLRRFLAKAFREQGFAVVEADSGDRALDRGLGGSQQCIILDVMLPGAATASVSWTSSVIAAWSRRF